MNEKIPGLLMTTHPAATTKTFQNVEMVISGAAPFSDSDITQFLNKAQVILKSDIVSEDQLYLYSHLITTFLAL